MNPSPSLRLYSEWQRQVRAGASLSAEGLGGGGHHAGREEGAAKALKDNSPFQLYIYIYIFVIVKLNVFKHAAKLVRIHLLLTDIEDLYIY